MKNIKLLNKKLEKEGAKWRAAESRISRLTAKQFKALLGWKKDAELPIKKAEPDKLGKMHKWTAGDTFDIEVDWRNRNGKNYITPVPEMGQGGCGCCVAFAVVALVESMALIEKGITLDLSEADLAFCGSHASDCGGWAQGGALNDLKSRGTVLDSRFPYSNAFPGNDVWNLPPACMNITDHNKYSVKISGYENIYSVSDRKSYLTHVGPLVAGISVYDDFYPAPGSIYSPSKTAKKSGGHCILIIGYSDSEKYWLCKNSWGTSWGDNGFFKIAYNTCDIEIANTYFTNCEGVIIPQVVLGEMVLNKGLALLSSIPGSFCCDGFFSGDDNMRHTISGTADGSITEIFFNPQAGHGQSQLTNCNGLADLGSFYTGDDRYRHVIAAKTNGDIIEIFYSPQSGLSIAPLATIKGATKICGFFTSDDNCRHAIVLTKDGKIIEIFYNSSGLGSSQIGNFNNVVDIGCFYSHDDNYRHVIATTDDGNLREIFFHPQKGIHSTVLTYIPGLTRVTAFYTSDNDFYNRRIQVLTKKNEIYEVRYHPVNGVITHLLLKETNESIVDIGGFFSPDDNIMHCIALYEHGNIKELFYTS